MRFRFRTLLIVLAVAVPGMIALTVYSHWAVIVLGWLAFLSIFAVWHRMLLKSQTNPKMRGEPDYHIHPG
ncbi:MAG TPA: hypothetical protein VGI40_00635 [Pirellulaceae bacterium]|jgi:hypothetical protein